MGSRWGDHIVTGVGYNDDSGQYMIVNPNLRGWGETSIQYGQGYSNIGMNTLTLSGSGTDTTPPAGDITSPNENETITNHTVHLAGWAQDNAGGSGFSHAHFTAYYNGSWRQVGPDFTSSPFGFNWNMCNDGVPDGPVTLGLDIWDNADNEANSPHGNRHFTKNYNCDSTCPQSGGVILYWNANYDCTNNEGDSGYRQRTSIGWQNVNDGQFNDRASSVKVPSGWSVRLFADANRGEPSVCFNSDIRGWFPEM